MKKLIVVSFLLSLFFPSCDKEHDLPLLGNKKEEFKAWCKLDNSIATTDDTFLNIETTDPKITVYILEELKTGADCNCIVSGKVKYVENCCMTLALVDYGDGDCDNWVSITECYFGDCESSKAKCLKYEQTCGSAEPTTLGRIPSNK